MHKNTWAPIILQCSLKQDTVNAGKSVQHCNKDEINDDREIAFSKFKKKNPKHPTEEVKGHIRASPCLL